MLSKAFEKSAKRPPNVPPLSRIFLVFLIMAKHAEGFIFAKIALKY